MKPTRLIQGLSALIIAFASMPSAHAMYCGNRLVSEGDTRAKVRALCGPPVDVQSRVVYLSSSYSSRWSGHLRPMNNTASRYGRHPGSVWGQQAVVPVPIEQWTFDQGRNRLMRVLTFENGRVTRIQTLGYGFQRQRPRVEARW